MSKNFLKYSTVLLLSILFLGQTGCPSPTSVAGQSTNNTQRTSVEIERPTAPVLLFKDLTNILLTKTDLSGAVNPIPPEDIEYISLNGNIIKGTDIELVGDNNFSTKGQIEEIVANGSASNKEANIIAAELEAYGNKLMDLGDAKIAQYRAGVKTNDALFIKFQELERTKGPAFAKNNYTQYLKAWDNNDLVLKEAEKAWEEAKKAFTKAAGLYLYFSTHYSIPVITEPVVLVLKPYNAPPVKTLLLPGTGNNVWLDLDGFNFTGGTMPGLISDNGLGVVSNHGGQLIASNGGKVVGQNGANVISTGGGGVISDNGLGIQELNFNVSMQNETLSNFDMSKSKSHFVSFGNQITVSNEDGSVNIYDLDKIIKSGFKDFVPTATKQVPIATYEAEKFGLSQKLNKISPIAPFVGSWIYKAVLFGVNQEIEVKVTDIGNNKFTAGALFQGKYFSGTGDFVDTNAGFDLKAETSSNPIKIKLKLEGLNKLSLTLIDAGGSTEIKPFVNVPFMLGRNKSGFTRQSVIK